MLTKKKELYNRRRQRSEMDRILQKQRAFFAEGKTYEIRFRKAALKRLEASILAHAEKATIECTLCEYSIVRNKMHVLQVDRKGRFVC